MDVYVVLDLCRELSSSFWLCRKVSMNWFPNIWWNLLTSENSNWSLEALERLISRTGRATPDWSTVLPRPRRSSGSGGSCRGTTRRWGRGCCSSWRDPPGSHCRGSRPCRAPLVLQVQDCSLFIWWMLMSKIYPRPILALTGKYQSKKFKGPNFKFPFEFQTRPPSLSQWRNHVWQIDPSCGGNVWICRGIRGHVSEYKWGHVRQQSLLEDLKLNNFST